MNFNIIQIYIRRKKIQRIIRKYIEKNDDIFFIQIGSNDGKTGDPIHEYIIKYNWKGILVEPVSYLFKKLQTTYNNSDNLIFENIAIAEKEGYKKFYRIKKNNEPNNPFWYDQIGSFDKNIVLKHKNVIPNFNKYLIEERIRCITLNQLLKRNKVKKIDLLHIDTEGYDFKIIKLINFENIKPKMILYENQHLSETDKIKCMDFLKNKKYSLVIQGGDTFAYLN